jgi:hypothetical protein
MNGVFVTLVKEILNSFICLSGCIVYVLLQFHALLFFNTPLFLSSSQ